MHLSFLPLFFEIIDQFVVSPEKLIAPERGYIANQYFALAFTRPAFTDPLAPSYADPEHMKYMGPGKTHARENVLEQITYNARYVQHTHTPQNYFWTLITHDGVCGAIHTYSEDDENTRGIGIMITKKGQGKGFAHGMFKEVFDALPQYSWQVTADPRNFRSNKAQLSAGLNYKKTEYIEEYRAFRNFYTRPSNNRLENNESVRFTYSGKVVRVSELLEE